MTKYENGIPFSEIVLQDAVCRKYGIKSLYYSKTKTTDDKQEDIEEDSCGSGGCNL